MSQARCSFVVVFVKRRAGALLFVVSVWFNKTEREAVAVFMQSRKYLRFFVSLLAFAMLVLLFPARVHADGGAPNLAYIAGTAHGISVIDIGRRQVTGAVPIASDPHTILLSADGRALYVTQPQSGSVVVIATKTKQTVCSAYLSGHPTLLTLDPGTNLLYVAANDAPGASALDPTNCAIHQVLQTRGPVYGLAVAVVGTGIAGGNGNQIWAAENDALAVFDSSGKALASIPVQDSPEYLCIPPGTIVYITTRQGTVLAVDLKSHQVVSSLLSGGIFGPMDYDAITGEVYVPDLRHNLLAVLAPLNSAASIPREPGHIMRLPASPQSIAITSDGQLGFVALGDGSVAMLDIPGRQFVTTFHVGGTPRFVVTGLYPSPLSLTPQQASVLSVLVNSSHYIAAGAIILLTILLVWRERRLRAKRLA